VGEMTFSKIRFTFYADLGCVFPSQWYLDLYRTV
jgi:hypothetical protein